MAKEKTVDTEKRIQPWSGNAIVPDGAIRVTTYAQYKSLIDKWASGVLDDTLIVIGGAGLGKSETALAALAKWPHCYLKGQATAKGVYMSLADHIDEPVVLDDIDSLLSNNAVTGLLKMLLETRSPRRIQWTTAATMSDDSNVPPEIVTKSRTLILANELKLVSKNFGAVLDRSTIIWFSPSPDEVHNYVGTWFDKAKNKEVYDYIRERIHLMLSPSCRFYVHGKKWKAAELPWQNMVNDLMKPSDNKTTIVVELLNDKALKTEKDRVRVWNERTGESEQSYHAHKRAVNTARGVVNTRSKAISEAMKKKHAERKAAK